MNVIQLSNETALIAIANENPAYFELSINAENGDLVYYKDSAKELTDLRQVIDYSKMETGFYYGAMYVSYGLTVFFGLSVFLLMCVLMNFDEIMFIITFAILQIIFMPVFYRTSRLVWINMFVSFKK